MATSSIGQPVVLNETTIKRFSEIMNSKEKSRINVHKGRKPIRVVTDPDEIRRILH